MLKYIELKLKLKFSTFFYNTILAVGINHADQQIQNFSTVLSIYPLFLLFLTYKVFNGCPALGKVKPNLEKITKTLMNTITTFKICLRHQRKCGKNIFNIYCNDQCYSMWSYWSLITVTFQFFCKLLSLILLTFCSESIKFFCFDYRRAATCTYNLKLISY